jgi:hypothetical protein
MYHRSPTKITVAANSMSPVIPIRDMNGAAITVIPGSGCTMRVFKSMSLRSDIDADLAGTPTLTYSNLIAGTQPTNSRWMLWASGPVARHGDGGRGVGLVQGYGKSVS